MSAMKEWKVLVGWCKGQDPETDGMRGYEAGVLAADRVVRAAKRVSDLHFAEGVEDMTAKQLDEYLRKLTTARVTLAKAVEAMEREG